MVRAKPKKVRVAPRIRQGVAGIPLDNWEKAKYYVHYELDKKPTMEIVKTYIKKEFSKPDAKAILANPDYIFHMYSHYATGIVWLNNGLEFPDNWKQLTTRIKEFYSEYIEKGKAILAEKAQEAEAKSNIRVLTPQQRLWNKVNETIVEELMDLEDEWMEGKETDFDMYNRMRFHDLKGTAVEIVRKRIDGWYADYYDAYHKKCEQAVEGYSHVPRKEQKRRMNVCKQMLDDLDKLKMAAKATRKVRVKKPTSADKQVSKLKYAKENNEYKLVSINPVVIPGSMRLFTFNVKTRVITEYVSQMVGGFEIKGTSLKGFDPEQSRQTRLRKPDDFIPLVQNKTVKQIDNAFKELSTKINQPNGRMNEDTILLRVMDK